MFQDLLISILLGMAKKLLTETFFSKFVYETGKTWADSDGDLNDWDNKIVAAAGNSWGVK